MQSGAFLLSIQWNVLYNQLISLEVNVNNFFVFSSHTVL